MQLNVGFQVLLIRPTYTGHLPSFQKWFNQGLKLCVPTGQLPLAVKPVIRWLSLNHLRQILSGKDPGVLVPPLERGCFLPGSL